MKKVLHFSGGKDSLACLQILKPFLDEILVMWCNTGAAYPSTIEQMEKIKKFVPHFMEVKSDQPAFIKRCGHPVDVVPIRHTPVGHLIHGTTGIAFTDYITCCHANLWEPLARATKEVGAEVIYRGQKNCDKKKSPIKSWTIVDGVQYIFPVEDMTDDEVRIFVKSNLPEYYIDEVSSRDCWNCTAYLEDNRNRINKLPIDQKIEVWKILDSLEAAIDHESKILNDT